MADAETTHLDLTGLKCPLPVLRTRKALRALAPGALLTVTCTDPMAAIDIPNLVREAGDEIVRQDIVRQDIMEPDAPGSSTGSAILSFTIRRRVAQNPHPPPH